MRAVNRSITNLLATLFMCFALAGCGTPLDPQQYVLRTEVRAAQQEPVADEPVDETEPDEETDAPAVPIKRRKVDSPARPVKSDDSTDVVDNDKPTSGRPTDVAKWQEADFLSARRALDPRLIDAVAYLVEEKPQDEQTANLLTAVIQYEAGGEDDEPVETVLVDDAIPADVAATHDAFIWVKEPTYPVYSGEQSIKRVVKGFDRTNDFHTCRFEKLADPVALGPRDKLFVYVHIDADDPPTALMLGYKTDRWHGAYWGPEDAIEFGAIRKRLGDVPEAGNWVRLEIPAAEVELDGLAIQGLALLQSGGTVYWDKAGVERHQTAELVAPIIAALGRNNTPPAKQTLANLLKGDVATLLQESQTAERAWRATVAGIAAAGEQVDGATREMLLDIVAAPTEYRDEDAEKFSADELFESALSKLKPLITAEMRMTLASKLADSSLTADKFRALTEILAEPIAENFAAQIKLYQDGAVEPAALLKFSENFAKLSGAALGQLLGLEDDDQPDEELSIAAAKELWTPQFAESIRARFIESQDAGVEPAAALFAMTMPLASNREALRVFYDEAAKTSGPKPLEDVGAFGENLIDPGMLPIFKRIWHNDPAARRKVYRRDDDLPLALQWGEAGRALAESMSERFYDAGDEGMFEGKSPISLHRGANVTRSFSRTWMGADDSDLGELAGHGIGTTIIRYARTEDELDEKLATRVHSFYSRQVSRALSHKIDENTMWIDGLTRGTGGRLRSVDVLIRIDRPEATGEDIEPIAGGGVGPPAAGGGVPALQLQQLQIEYQRYREKLADATAERLEYLEKLQRARDLEDRQRRTEQVQEQEARITRYRGKLAELETNIRTFREFGGPGRPPERREPPRPRAPATPGKVPVQIDVLVVEIDPPAGS